LHLGRANVIFTQIVGEGHVSEIHNLDRFIQFGSVDGGLLLFVLFKFKCLAKKTT
jgi:hypothetical protein